jgi:WD40 repeat protein
MPSANPDKLKLARELARKEIVFALARQTGGSRLFFAGSDGKVYDADLSQDKPEPKEIGTHGGYVDGLALAGTTLVSGGYDGRLVWWDIDRAAQIRAVDAHPKWVRCVVATPDGKKVASVADDMVCRVWDADSGQLLHELRGHKEKTPNDFPSMLYACAVSPDGQHLATGDKVGHVVVWDLSSGKQLAAIETPEMYTWDPVQRRHSIGGIRALAFSPDGALLAVGGIGKIGNIDHLDGKARVEVFDWQKGERTHEFANDKFKGLVEHLAFAPEGEWLLGAGGAQDGFLMFFDLKEKKAGRQEKVSVHLHDAVLNETGDTIYLAGHNKVLVYEMKG